MEYHANRNLHIHEEIRELITQKNYPCVAAVQSVARNDYLIGVYSDFGTGKSWQRFRKELLSFLSLLKLTGSKYLSFWAVFEDPLTEFSEDDFEKKFWQEVSMLSSEEERARDWGPENSSDPTDPSFCLSLNGEKLFVVGLHKNSSRKSRQFSKPTFVFNAFSQFEKFKTEGTYDSLVTTTRVRDKKFQGSTNPMAVQHGEQWESIQFSGKQNPTTWKCPFHFFMKKDKAR